jgi:hypothetical protein
MKRCLASNRLVVFPAFPLLPHRYRGEQTRSGPALEFNCPKKRFATEKLFVLYRDSILSLQRLEIMHILRPLVGHYWEEKASRSISHTL